MAAATVSASVPFYRFRHKAGTPERPRGEVFAYLPNLRELRQRAGLSQFRLAVATYKLGRPVTLRTIQRLERMQCPARFPTIHRLAAALGCTAEQLARFTDTDADTDA